MKYNSYISWIKIKQIRFLLIIIVSFTAVLSCDKEYNQKPCHIELSISCVVNPDVKILVAETNLTDNNRFSYGTIQKKWFSFYNMTAYCSVYVYESHRFEREILTYDDFLEWVKETVPDPFIDICYYSGDFGVYPDGAEPLSGAGYLAFHYKECLENLTPSKTEHSEGGHGDAIYSYYTVFYINCTEQIQEMLDSLQ